MHIMSLIKNVLHIEGNGTRIKQMQFTQNLPVQTRICKYKHLNYILSVAVTESPFIEIKTRISSHSIALL